MEKYARVQVEILLTADEKALLEHYVKENNQRYRKRGATRNWWTLENVLQCLLNDVIYTARCKSHWYQWKRRRPSESG